MKVLSLTEPYASLILSGKKVIETRSFKTNYRGELYIHASMTKMAKETLNNNELMNILNDTKLNYGYIICKCNLVDCIYMSDEYVENMKNNNYEEYICGEYKKGRYAWILENIIPLDKKIRVKGQLGIWNYYDENEIMNLMENINYGYLDKDGCKHDDVNKLFSSNYILQSPSEVIKNKVGVCWDQVELERYYFKNHDINIKTYFIVHYDNDKCPTHTFLTYVKDGLFYYFEHSWERFKGIHKYNSLKDLLMNVKNNFIKYELKNNYIEDNLIIREYSNPKYHLNVQEFYKHCENGIIIDIDKL